MVVRLYKVLGYALTDIVENDPRLKRSPHDIFEEIDEDGESCATRFWAELDSQKGFWENWTEERRKEFDLLKMMDWGDESDQIVVFVPASKIETWRRSNDDIDYYEDKARAEGLGEDWCEARVRTLSIPLYHYDRYVDKRYPREMERTLRITDLTNLLGGLAAVSKSKASLEALGYTEADYKRFVRPLIPLCVRTFCRVFDLFKDPEMVWELQPAVNVYWS